jgi:hypothetical protein
MFLENNFAVKTVLRSWDIIKIKACYFRYLLKAVNNQIGLSTQTVIKPYAELSILAVLFLVVTQ